MGHDPPNPSIYLSPGGVRGTWSISTAGNRLADIGEAERDLLVLWCFVPNAA
jgi:hypothetical protein